MENLQEEESNAALWIFGVPPTFFQVVVSYQLMHMLKVEED